MRYPKLKAPEKRRVLINSFRGYEHTSSVSAGAFYDMKNLSGERAPLLGVRSRRTEIPRLDGCPMEWVNAIGGRGAAVVLDCGGTLWCGSEFLPRLLDGTVFLAVYDEQNQPVTVTDSAAVLRAIPTTGDYRYRYNAATRKWTPLDNSKPIAGELIAPDTLQDGMNVRVSHIYTLRKQGKRELVFLGGWVCVFPDGKYANTVKVRAGEALTEGVDYGNIAQFNECREGGTLFTPCGEDGTPWNVVWSGTAPTDGYWVDTSEPTHTVRVWSQSQGLWLAVNPYVKCEIPGIAKGLRAGDSVELSSLLDTNQGGELEVEALWKGPHVLTDAYHDPGAANRDEGRNDYVILPGLLSQSYEIELTWHDRSSISICRSIPEMDFVVEAGNRLWGCRCSGGVNELYGSKLGDFRNWNAFEGLSTDSYRVSRGHDGPYTGAAVLDGCPLFFRADCLEKIYPAAAGDHGVVTVSLEGIEPGSAGSAVVIRDRLYYKALSGVYCYNGTLPVLISRPLGDVSYHGAVAGARGRSYYICMLDPDGEPSLFVYDTDTGIWYREDDFSFLSAYSLHDRLYLQPELGWPMLCVGEATDSRDVDWWLETGDLSPRMGTKRYVTRVQVTAKLDPGAELRVYLSFDGGPWLRRGELRGSSLCARTLSVFARRCGRLRLRLEGSGGMELHGLSWLTEAGSDV